MTINDDELRKIEDEEFENYLKQFQPMQAAPLLQRDVRRHIGRPYVSMFLAASFAILLIVGAFMLDHHAAPMWGTGEIRILISDQPSSGLTIGNANLLLQQSSSVREALNSIARDPKVSLPQGKSSAFAALGKESFKL